MTDTANHHPSHLYDALYTPPPQKKDAIDKLLDAVGSVEHAEEAQAAPEISGRTRPRRVPPR